MAFFVLRVFAAAIVAALAFAPMSATAESPTPGSVVFAGGFESGKLSPPWSSGQCANTGIQSDNVITRGTANVTVRLVGQGKYAARFNLPATDRNNACEVLHQRLIGLETDDYYGLMVFFPKNWREPSAAGWGLAIAQFNFQGIHGPSVGLFAHARNVALVVQTGLCRPSGCAYSSGADGNVAPMVAVPSPLVLGAWHELIVHVHWTTTSAGVIEVWRRLKGQAGWRKSVDRRGYPTVQWTEDRLSILRFNATVDKIGAYRGPSDLPLSIWADGFVRAASFNAAAAALP